MGNSSTILPGEVQIMSAGTGVFHSEFNHEKERETHLLQIWILPKKKQITPRYDQKSFTQDFEKNDFVLVVSGSGRDGSIQINQDAEIFLAKFSAGKNFNFAAKKQSKIWLQIISGEISLNGETLINGDAAAIEDGSSIELIAKKNCEFLLFDL
jgi:redox-sensitive bicupin YhaK (pirin superfamily)